MVTFEAIWQRIKNLEGEKFRQIRGQEFSYTVEGTFLVPSTTNQNLAQSHFRQAVEILPLENTSPVQHLRGPSYIYAILMDPRVRGKDW